MSICEASIKCSLRKSNHSVTILGTLNLSSDLYIEGHKGIAQQGEKTKIRDKMRNE